MDMQNPVLAMNTSSKLIDAAYVISGISLAFMTGFGLCKSISNCPEKVLLGISIVIDGAYIAFNVYREYGWKIFEVHGASLFRRRVQVSYDNFKLYLNFSVYFSFCAIIPFLFVMIFDKLSTNHFSTTATIEFSFAIIFLSVLSLAYPYIGKAALTRKSSAYMIAFFNLNVIHATCMNFFTIVIPDIAFAMAFYPCFFMYLVVAMNIFNFIYGLVLSSYRENNFDEAGKGMLA
jgi:hypothetical protein